MTLDENELDTVIDALRYSIDQLKKPAHRTLIEQDYARRQATRLELIVQKLEAPCLKTTA